MSAELTTREVEVLSCVAEKGRETTCAELKLAASTLKKHLENIYRKLNAFTFTEAIFQAARLGAFGGSKDSEYPYDGSPASVRKIMEVLGSKGVNNSPDGLYLPELEYMGRGDSLVSDGTSWWIKSPYKIQKEGS